ncbi:E3 ubiquitin-protein ligase Itchy-like [Amphiura filiformis]|uniref:E3 ubiquitin-protein ligase Itchy-like n=1 Tax=Amphiura filiformis TaxID=82378 RepID=UPI003B22497A
MASGQTQAPLSQLQVTIKSAKLKDTGSGFFSKGDPYVEMTVDGQPPRKTEVVKKTWHPSWNEHFTVLVKPDTCLDFKVFNHFAIKSDVPLGHGQVQLLPLLKAHNGKLTNLPFALEIKTEVKGNTVKGGDLHLVFDGLCVKADVLARLGVIIQNGPSSQPNGDVGNAHRGRSNSSQPNNAQRPSQGDLASQAAAIAAGALEQLTIHQEWGKEEISTTAASW